jgi:uroporphyrin-III C-methyltransferase
MKILSDSIPSWRRVRRLWCLSSGAHTPTGKVYLVGAGPGDPGLFTLKGKGLLQCADVVIHDALVSPPILAMINPWRR